MALYIVYGPHGTHVDEFVTAYTKRMWPTHSIHVSEQHKEFSDSEIKMLHNDSRQKDIILYGHFDPEPLYRTLSQAHLKPTMIYLDASPDICLINLIKKNPENSHALLNNYEEKRPFVFFHEKIKKSTKEIADIICPDQDHETALALMRTASL